MFTWTTTDGIEFSTPVKLGDEKGQALILRMNKDKGIYSVLAKKSLGTFRASLADDIIYQANNLLFDAGYIPTT